MIAIQIHTQDPYRYRKNVIHLHTQYHYRQKRIQYKYTHNTTTIIKKMLYINNAITVAQRMQYKYIHTFSARKKAIQMHITPLQ